LSNYRSKYQSLDVAGLAENYASINFGGKFFSYNDAKKIGHIREDIESNKEDLTQKEYAILIASLLYSSDKAANTVGHYDAYIKNKELKDKFQFDLIEPSNTGNVAIEIHREDANLLVRNISCDIVYIDPPYNSRQYSRFYHVLENITKWEKPKLEGVALKPQPENMSEYCKSSAPEAFSDLISNLNCKYVVVSYNNTYNSKSNSSKNKIDLDFIRTTLEKKGRLSVFEKSHNFFNAGKTDFSDHKEFVFIVKVGE
jgi:adenine-specific DNA-methyltransferase